MPHNHVSLISKNCSIKKTCLFSGTERDGVSLTGAISALRDGCSGGRHVSYSKHRFIFFWLMNKQTAVADSDNEGPGKVPARVEDKLQMIYCFPLTNEARHYTHPLKKKKSEIEVDTCCSRMNLG